MKCILVTGASGFVGRAVCEKALGLGLRVKGSHRSVNSGSLIPLGVEKFQVSTVDRSTDWSKALVGVDAVVHLAARLHVTKETTTDTLAVYREINTAGTERLATMAIQAGVRRLLYASTIKVNGEQTGAVPFTEVDSPRPQDPYAMSKWESEQMLNALSIKSGLDIVILRPPLVYGRGVGANFMRLVHLVQKGFPLPLGSVSNRRSLIYVRNLADVILTCVGHPRAKGQTFLVSDGTDVSTPELIRCLANLMNVPTNMIKCPIRLLCVLGKLVGRSAELGRLVGSLAVDSTKVRIETGWVPAYTTHQGLEDTVRWYLSANPVD